MFDVAAGHLAGLHAGIWCAVAISLIYLASSPLKRRGGGRIRTAVESVEAAPLTVQAVAACLLISAVVHIALFPEHLGHSVPTAVLFAADGVALGFMSVAVFRWSGWRKPTVYLLLGNLLGYITWIVAGWEQPDQVGVATKFIELVALALVLSLAPQRRFRLPRRIWRSVRFTAFTAVLTLGMWVGSLAHPNALHAHAGATFQATQDRVTGSQVEGAKLLREQTRQAIAKYQDVRVAIAAGYRGFPTAVDGALVHYSNSANNGYVLDPSHPQALVYAATHHGMRLVGAMYQMSGVDNWGPDPGGPLTPWHQHEGICATAIGGFGLSFATPFWTCPVGSVSVVTQPMLHVWTIDNPKGGPFSADLDPTVVHQLVQS